jgi:hypothetical protein
MAGPKPCSSNILETSETNFSFGFEDWLWRLGKEDLSRRIVGRRTWIKDILTGFRSCVNWNNGGFAGFNGFGRFERVS